jgi:hypothetical protein
MIVTPSIFSWDESRADIKGGDVRLVRTFDGEDIALT